jgi:hypothetical protein
MLDTASLPQELELYSEATPARIPYVVPIVHAFDEAERRELTALLNVSAHPYLEYPEYKREIVAIAARAPEFLQRIGRLAKANDPIECPIFYLKNCPTGHVPDLDFDDPLASKHARKRDFVAEAFLSVFAELQGTTIITYRTANQGDMFHDIHPVRQLQYTMSQKTVNTLHFHTDLPDNRVRPDWVHLLSLRNSSANEVYTAFARVRDALDLDAQTLETLRQPLFHSPKTRVKNNISVYGEPEAGFLALKPIIISDRGFDYLCYNQSYTTSDHPEGQRALSTLSARLPSIRCSLFLAPGDFVAMCNNTTLHARHVVRIRDLEAHRHRWLLKTWNVDDLALHRHHLVAGEPYTVDE